MNNLFSIKNNFKTTFSILMFFICCSVTSFFAGQGSLLSPEEIQNLSPAEQQEYQKAFEEQLKAMSPAEQETYMEDMVQSMFDSLSPEQQQEVLEEAERIQNMDEEEQKAYFQQVEKELEENFGKPEEEQAAPIEPQPEPEVIVKKTEIKAKTSEKEKAIKEALNLLAEVAQGIDNLLIKIESKEDFMFKLSTWSKKNKIKSWNETFKWNELKEKIDLLRSQLDILKDRDPKTNEYKHLLNLLENKELYDKIYGISIDLAEFEPMVRVSKAKPLSKKIRKASHKALRSLINSFSTIIFPKDSETSLTKEISGLIAKFDPTAKKIKTEEEKQAQKALAKSKRKGPASRVKVGGRASRQSGRGDRYQEDDDFDYSQYAPGFEQFEQDDIQRKTGLKPQKQTPSKTASDRKTPSQSYEKAEDEEKYKKDRRFNRLYKSLETSLEAIENNFDESPKLNNLQPYFEQNNFDERLAKNIASTEQFLRRAASKLESMQKRMSELSDSSKKAYTKDVKALLGDYKSTITDMFNTVKLVGDIPKGNASMRWVHFGVKPVAKKGEKLSDVVQKNFNKF
ncbi:hypothetical protein KAH94_04690, partial [bacterium]|nr:hypothetical protein [bacterium]